MTKVAVRDNKKYIKTSRKVVANKKENSINKCSLIYFMFHNNPNKWFTPVKATLELAKDGVGLNKNEVNSRCCKLSGKDVTVREDLKRDELICRKNKYGLYEYKLNPNGTYRGNSSKALRTVTYNNVSKAEFITK
jgi:hypothetical protein